MKNLLIRNGTIISPTDGIKFEKRDILVLHGKIYAIGLNLKEKIRKEKLLTNKEFEIINADNMYISPGFIDVHAHCYKRKYLQVWILIQLELKKVLQLYLMQVQLVLQTTMILKKSIWMSVKQKYILF
ncbi:hypothetical protein ACE5L3_16665 [Clostridioides difficile]|uniref:hypothetical protein n=1 Tax=Clostridioides difficile TaxID=1496 RepID=UPI001F343A87|nr:hypothetical protein [Clostridioides difficile]MCI4722517.1 hypothetical protein [Clostridioides difficile]MCK3745861.1 hypothetical protein [Clostridioides difficile]MCL0943026.1 hypothetical protein [Clostridioides difficile]MCZ1100833.1 hypothetical protein [Clostridioides difficile]MDI2846160.1 hypothetical protein [Clostridioides difficile]